MTQDSNLFSTSISRHPRPSVASSLMASIRNPMMIARTSTHEEAVTSGALPSLAAYSPASPTVRTRKSSNFSRRKKNILTIKSQTPSRQAEHVEQEEDCQTPRIRTSYDPFAPPTPGLTPIIFQNPQFNTAPSSAKTCFSTAFRDGSSAITHGRPRSSTIADFSQRCSHPEEQTEDRYQSASSPLARRSKCSISLSQPDNYRVSKDLSIIENTSKNTTSPVPSASRSRRIASFQLSEDITKEWNTAKLFLASDEGDTSIETIPEESPQPHSMQEQIDDHQADHKITLSPDSRAQTEGNREASQNSGRDRLTSNLSKITGRSETPKVRRFRKKSQSSTTSHSKDQPAEKYLSRSSGLTSPLSKSICSVYYSALGHHD
ncbi:uncharacterized protein MELLADRAFT_72991 [Melampsora larici-populina 98AG31]|uniref:Uncharacterized protein n=1 Tax=Melampsora larici-populina (strain 98AG31 / pathotype 3-4-7) TaxID=747676 RepID=F4S1R1_MELLP|nr:uncharacterized protein MELLADRAFT_72991 [Melampsora larici-populina 98AG31]EGG01418.1 hypothetical protein MELLADRAFT_72991 [Melampsora larici-populina 98AG31]